MASKKRVICGLLVASVWVIAITCLPVWVLSLLIALSAGVCLYELCAMLKKGGYELPFTWLAVVTGIWFAIKYMMTLTKIEAYLFSGHLLLPLAAVLAAVLFFRVMLDRRIQQPMGTAALTVVSFFYIPFMLSFLLDLVAYGKWSVLGGTPSEGAGIFLAFFCVLITKLCDTGGYFIGSSFGKHKMCPRLSPGKSWEGTAGGYGFSLTATIIVMVTAALATDCEVFEVIRQMTKDWLWIIWTLLTVIAVITVGILGDLFESLFKRQCGVKDSSALFPAMGGFFDTFDSLIFVPATVVFMLQLGQYFLD